MQKLNNVDVSILRNNLLFLNIEELKMLNKKLSLSDKGKKGDLILRIIHFIQTGEKLIIPKFSANSYAKKETEYLLSPEALILKGAYKNDLKTHLFFKKIDRFSFSLYCFRN